MDLLAKIKGIVYKPLLCKNLEIFEFDEIENAVNKSSSFILKINKENSFAISWWVSAKRTRSYPYARVYDTLGFSGKKITIIPIFKDEGKDGDRDFLQWDTISLMSLPGIYVIIAYYVDAEKNPRYLNKITNQKFDICYIKKQIKSILSYQSDALHWNLKHIDDVSKIAQQAIKYYEMISKKLGVEMHSRQSAEGRVSHLLKGKHEFMRISRTLAEQAQIRESRTIQPKEKLSGKKSTITIKNYLGGFYYFTCDEVEIKDRNIFLIEAKHSKTNLLPSIEDIKDGLLKMILFTNLEDVTINGQYYHPVPVLKLTSKRNLNENTLSESQKETLSILREESKINKFQIKLM